MAGTYGHFFVFYTYLCLIFVHTFLKSIRKMSTALKKNSLLYSGISLNGHSE